MSDQGLLHRHDCIACFSKAVAQKIKVQEVRGSRRLIPSHTTLSPPCLSSKTESAGHQKEPEASPICSPESHQQAPSGEDWDPPSSNGMCTPNPGKLPAAGQLLANSHAKVCNILACENGSRLQEGADYLAVM